MLQGKVPASSARKSCALSCSEWVASSIRETSYSSLKKNHAHIEGLRPRRGLLKGEIELRDSQGAKLSNIPSSYLLRSVLLSRLSFL